MPPTMTIAGSAVDSERDREALDDVGAVAGDRRLGDRIDRALVGAGVVFGDDHDQRRHDEADEAADEQVLAGDRACRRPCRSRPSRWSARSRRRGRRSTARR